MSWGRSFTFLELFFLMPKRRDVDYVLSCFFFLSFFPPSFFSLTHTCIDYPLKDHLSNKVNKWISQTLYLILRFLQFLSALKWLSYTPVLGWSSVSCSLREAGNQREDGLWGDKGWASPPVSLDFCWCSLSDPRDLANLWSAEGVKGEPSQASSLASDAKT